MKKTVAILICICCLLITGCKDDGNKIINDEGRLMTVEEVLATAGSAGLTCDKYQLKKYTQTLWNSQIIYNETVMFIKDSTGNIPEKKLAFPIAKVLEVRDSTLKTLYTEGSDYEITQNGDLKVLSGSAIYVTDYDDYYLATDKAGGIGALSKSEQGRFLDYGEGVYFYNKQVCVTYIRTAEYEGAKPEFSENELPLTVAKLKNRENLKVVFYGDSIITGCNSSGNYNSLPNMPLFSTMAVNRLKDAYGYDGTDITNINTAVGGWLSENGKGELTTRVLDYNPDLVVIGFGMNDGTWGVSDEVYGSNMNFMVQKIKEKNADCEIILLSTMLPNPDATTSENGDYMKKQKDYLPVLNEIAGGYNGVAVGDITSVHEYLLTRKDYCDMTGNNINHPSDFLVRIYSQVILSHLILRI